ncbi:MAG TPA: M56 family metallopeptidase [Longimicrobium sp.]
MSALLPDLAFPLAVVVKATLLLAAAAVAAGVLAWRRAPAAARHLVWTLAVCGVLALPLFSITLPGWRLAFVRLQPPAAPLTEELPPLPPVSALPPASAGTLPELPPIPASVAPTVEVTPPANAIPFDGEMAIPVVYLLGVIALLGRLLAGRWSVRRLARAASPVTGEAWTALLRDLRWMMDVDRPVTLLRGAGATMPMTWGTRRPTILLPEEAVEWPEDRRRVVLLHELAHVARHDCLTQTLAALACALYWFHPGAWYAARRLRVERELACDDRVLAAGTRAKEYASHLLEVARGFRAPPLAAAAAVSMARPSQLEGRLLAVLDHLRSRHALTRRAGLGAAAAALALVLPLSAARPASAVQDPKPRSAPAPASPEAAMARAREAARHPSDGCVLSRGSSLSCTIDARPGERLSLRLPAGVSARVVGWDRAEVVVRLESSSRTFDASADRMDGGVRVAVARASGHGGNGPDLEIQVPRRFDVATDADGGGVEIRGVEGNFTGNTRGGGVAFIDAGGTVRMDAGGGGAYISHTRLSGRLEMRGGGVLLDENRGNLDISGANATVRGSAADLGAWGERVRGEVEAANEAASRAISIDRVLTGNVAKDGGPIVAATVQPGARLYTGGGDITVRRAQGDISATTGGGDVRLESVAGGAKVSTGAGDVLVRVDGQGGDVEVTSGRGGVTLVLPDGFSGSVDLETAYTQNHAATRITSDVPLAISETREWSAREGTPRRYVRGRATLGSGRHRVHVRTVNGDVRLVRGGDVAVAGRGRGSRDVTVNAGGAVVNTAGSGNASTVSVGGADVACAGQSCTVTLPGTDVQVSTSAGATTIGYRTGAADARGGTVGYVSGSGERTVLASDPQGYAYALGDVPERIRLMGMIGRNSPAAAAAQALGRFAFADPDARVRRAAVDALAEIRGRERDEQLRRIARDHPSASIRRRASEALR